MVEIPIPDKFKKDDKKQPPPLRSEGEPFNENAENQCKCLSKRQWFQARRRWGDQVFPICPVLSEIVKDDKWSIPELPKSGAPLLDSINRILCGFGGLLRRLKPDFEALVWCAHKRFVLDGLTSLIEDDLTNLPLRMEKEFPSSSPKVDKLISQLKAVFRESSIHLLQGLQLYLLPQQYLLMIPILDQILENGSDKVVIEATEFELPNYEAFLYWRNEEIYRAKEKDVDERIVKDLTCTYPAEAIEVMRKIFDELSPLAQILSEKVGEGNRLIDEVKLTLDEHLIKLTGIKHNGTADINQNGGKVRAEIKKGSMWVFNFNGEPVSVDGKLKGLKLLEVLLTHKNREYTPLELLKEAGLESQGSTTSELVYESKDKQLINNNRENLMVAYSREQDPAKKAELKEQIDKADEIMKKATNISGKSRSMSDKYRIRVDSLIKTILGKIIKDNPQLHNHFDAFLHFPSSNSYKPDKNIEWNIK